MRSRDNAAIIDMAMLFLVTYARSRQGYFCANNCSGFIITLWALNLFMRTCVIQLTGRRTPLKIKFPLGAIFTLPLQLIKKVKKQEHYDIVTRL